MQKLLLVLILVFSVFAETRCQNYNELGIGFSGMRTWEIDPPERLRQDLDYYYSPNISYQFYFLDGQFSIGALVGLAEEVGRKTITSDQETEDREDIRKSLIYQLNGSVNLFRTRRSFFQVTAGARATRTYFFSHYSEAVTSSGGTRSGGYELNRWYDPMYSALLSIAYQRAVLNELDDKHSLSFRVAWDFIYFFTEFYGTTNGVVNEYASFATGPSVSLVWRIRGKKNTGLF